MDIKLVHNFATKCFNKSALFAKMYSPQTGELNPNKCNVATYMDAVIKQAEGPDNTIEPNVFRWEPSNYVGDGFELFAEALIKLIGLHPDIGIVDYIPQPGKDNGVDGVGKGILDLKTVTVQVKYRPNALVELSAGKDRLDSFFSSSVVHHDIELKKDSDGKFVGPRRMLVITTAAGLAEYTENEKFLGTMRCLRAKWIDDNINGNVAFWKQFIELIA